MADEKKTKDEQKLKAEELTDEQANGAAGGSASVFEEKKKCYICGNKLPYNYPGFLCKNCKDADSGVSIIQISEPR